MLWWFCFTCHKVGQSHPLKILHPKPNGKVVFSTFTMRNLSPFWAWGEGSSGDSSGQLYGRLKQNHGKWWNCVTWLDNWSAWCILKDLPQKLLPGLCSHSHIASNFKPNYCLKILHLCAFSGHGHCLIFIYFWYFFPHETSSSLCKDSLQTQHFPHSI